MQIILTLSKKVKSFSCVYIISKDTCLTVHLTNTLDVIKREREANISVHIKLGVYFFSYPYLAYNRVCYGKLQLFARILSSGLHPKSMSRQC
jgi:hypothetical protein